MPSEVVGHILRAIELATCRTDPWPHYCASNVFPAEFYEELLCHFPPRALFEPLGRSTPNRLLYWLSPGRSVLPYWGSLRDELFEPLRKELEDKLGVVGASWGAEIVHDLPGYYLGPHTDTPDKAITCIFYLPDRGTDSDQGTILCRGREADPRGKGHKFSGQFAEVKTVPYVPNSMLFFERTDWSFHCVRPTSVDRWSLAFDVFK